jgi:hypothetical protein
MCAHPPTFSSTSREEAVRAFKPSSRVTDVPLIRFDCRHMRKTSRLTASGVWVGRAVGVSDVEKREGVSGLPCSLSLRANGSWLVGTMCKPYIRERLPNFVQVHSCARSTCYVRARCKLGKVRVQKQCVVAWLLPSRPFKSKKQASRRNPGFRQSSRAQVTYKCSHSAPLL